MTARCLTSSLPCLAFLLACTGSGGGGSGNTNTQDCAEGDLTCGGAAGEGPGGSTSNGGSAGSSGESAGGASTGGNGTGGSATGGTSTGGTGVGGNATGGAGPGGTSAGGTGAGGGSSGGSGGTGGTGATAGSGGAGGTGPVNPHAVGSEIHVNTTEPSQQHEPRIASADDGSFVVVWMSDDQAASGYAELWGQRFDATGAKLGGEFQISSTQASNTYYDASRYDIAMAGDGRFVVVWSGYGSTDIVLYAQRYDAAGAPIGGNMIVDDTTDQWTEYKASVAMADDGSYAILHDWEAGFTTGLKATTYDTSNVPIATEFWITDLRRAYEIDLAVAKTGTAAGTYVAVYRYYDLDTEVYGQPFDADGTLLGSEIHVNTSTTGAQSHPSVDMRDDGSFVVVWQSDHATTGPSYGVYAQRYDGTGAAVGGEITLSDATSGSLNTPGVVTGSDGTFLAVWSGDEGLPTVDWAEVWGRYFDAAGAPAGDAFQINTFTDFRQQEARVSGVADGASIVVWTDYEQEITAAGGDDTREYGVYAQRMAR